MRSGPALRDWRWAVGTIGKVLIATGLLMFAFVGYQLWGTGLEYARAQDRLDTEFERLLATATTAPPEATDDAVTDGATPTTDAAAAPTLPHTAPGTSVATVTAPVTAPAPPLSFQPGDVLARLEIPSIELDTKVVSGVAPDDLKAGPGHYPATPLPGRFGNAAIAGHRTTYGQPFFRLDEIRPGDEIVVTTVEGRFVYRTTGSEVVDANRSDVVATTDPDVARLTLTTCHPRYSATRRLIVYADLDPTASPPAGPTTAGPAPPDPTLPGEPVPTTDGATIGPSTAPTSPPSTAPATAPTTATTTPPATSPGAAPSTSPGGAAPAGRGADTAAPATEAATDDAFDHGWFSDDAAFGQVAVWGLALSAVGVGAWLLSRRAGRDWVGALAGVVPFVVALYFFFQNVNRLLPAAL